MAIFRPPQSNRVVGHELHRFEDEPGEFFAKGLVLRGHEIPRVHDHCGIGIGTRLLEDCIAQPIAASL